MCQIYKPDSVSRQVGVLPFIYATYPPGQASSPQARVYMVLQPARFTQIPITREARELLPHVFTLTVTQACLGGIFSVALADAAKATPLFSKGAVL